MPQGFCAPTAPAGTVLSIAVGSTAGTSAAEQEEILSRWQDACSARGWSFKVSAERAKWFGTGFQRVLSIDDPALMILLYDGSAADSTGLTMR